MKSDSSLISAKIKKWENIFSIRPQTTYYLLSNDLEWTLDVSAKYLKDPKQAHDRWFQVWASALTLLGKEKAYELKHELHHHVHANKFMDEGSLLRNSLRRKRIRKAKTPPQETLRTQIGDIMKWKGISSMLLSESPASL